jgi:hypothetical protein
MVRAAGLRAQRQYGVLKSIRLDRAAGRALGFGLVVGCDLKGECLVVLEARPAVQRHTGEADESELGFCISLSLK